MVKTQNTRMDTRKLVTAGLMTAFVIVCQLLATYTTFFGPFNTAIALVPIAIGAILCGPAVGAWLGFIFAVVVIATGGANLFFLFDIPGTIVTVLAKGIMCGWSSGMIYKLLFKFNKIFASVAAAIVCPIVNIGVFMLGCLVFFMDDVVGIAAKIGSAEAGVAVFVAMALGNFLFELGMSTVLSPIIVRVLNIRKSQKN